MQYKLMYSPFYKSWHILRWWPYYNGAWRITDVPHKNGLSAYERMKELASNA